MKVKFKNSWYAPNGLWYSAAVGNSPFVNNGVHEVPDELFSSLPSTAVVVHGGPPVVKVEVPVIAATFKDFDNDRLAGVVEDKFVKGKK